MRYFSILIYKQWKCKLTEDSFSLSNENIEIAEDLTEFELLSKAILQYRMYHRRGNNSCICISDKYKNINLVIEKGDLDAFFGFLDEVTAQIEKMSLTLLVGDPNMCPPPTFRIVDHQPWDISLN
ncbi:MAG: hypothetical protein AAF927_10730 [Bacteroidota bacterium]